MIEQIKADRETGTPAPWIADEDEGEIYHEDNDVTPWVAAVNMGECATDLAMADARRIARVPAMEAALIAAEDAVSSCDEILRLMIENIEVDGHYSIESTVTFLQGARSELNVYRKAMEAAQ